MTFSVLEIAWMRRALRLAARGFTAPNPMVGCVIVRDREVVGEGFHPAAGKPHAEVFALDAAGERARGATAYVTLEPCCHWGRTPPCTDALLAAGVGRVVVATSDTDPRVRGKGLEILRSRGMDVSVGLLETEARLQNEAFFFYHAHGLPFVTMKAAVTADGKIATRTGDATWVSGPASRRSVHRLRARSGAVMVGIGTLIADDALLTARPPGPPPPRQPLRVVVDSRLRTSPESRAVLSASDDAPLLIATTFAASATAESALARDGVAVLRLPAGRDGRVDLHSLMEELGRSGVISVLCEGGGELNASLLEAGLIQKSLLFIAPKLVGGRDAPTAVEGVGVSRMRDAVGLENVRVRRFGADVAIEGYVCAAPTVDVDVPTDAAASE